MRTLYLLIPFLLQFSFCQATVHRVAFSAPVTLSGESVVAIDIDGDSTYDISFRIKRNLDSVMVCFVEMNGASDAIESVPLPGWNAIAHSCGDTFSLYSKWEGITNIATEVGNCEFDGAGVKYLAFRKYKGAGYIYGWFRISANTTATSLTLLDFAYNDVPSVIPNILAGEGLCITDVNNQDTESGIKVFPNPASDVFTIDLTALQGGDVSYRLLNINGQQVLGGEGATDKLIPVDLANVSKGVYLLSIELAGSVYHKKVIAQ